MSMLRRLSHVFAKTVLAAAAVANASTAIAACNIIDGKAYGDCAGVTVNQGTKPPLQVRGALSESGIVAGATVFGGGSLHLSGISNGDVTIQKGGRLILTGVVNGTVRNLGGTVEIEGTLESLFTISGKVTVAGTVGSVAGPGAVTFRRGSVLGSTPFESATKRSGNP
jgi:hypothetical protein